MTIRLADRLRAKGFVRENTGGNCSAYVRQTARGTFMVTSSDVAEAPPDLVVDEHEVDYSVHLPGDSEPFAPIVQTTAIALFALLDALTEPTESP